MKCKLNFTNLEACNVAQVSKQKTVRLGKKVHARKEIQRDDGMVVFPMANGKLATTWVSNVDNILSEGTGELDLERMKILKDKLTNTLSLLESRISDLAIEQADKAAKAFIEGKLKYLKENGIGKTVKFSFNVGKSFFGVVTSVEIINDRLFIQGLYPNYMQRNSDAFAAYSHSGVAQFTYKTSLRGIHFRDLDDPSHFILSSDETATTLEFGLMTEQSCVDTIKGFLHEIYEQLHAIEKPKKKLAQKKPNKVKETKK